MSSSMRSLSLVALLLAFTVLIEHAAAMRNIPAGIDRNDKKEPEWLLDHDGSLLIPGIGRVMVPPKYRAKLGHGGGLTIPYMGSPSSGGSPFAGGSPPSTGGSPPSGGSYIPGGDDTYVPNPGVEVPNPVGGGNPAPNSP